MEFAILIPLFAIGVPMVIAVTAILTTHQRKMAEILRQNSAQPEVVHEIYALRTEVAALRERVNEQAIQVDNLATLRGVTTPPPIETRLNLGG